ncbi:aminoglycoside phosphotransferase family protein [Pseudofrankia sp. BMG5.36]|uniref:aminoglycoside phosphotransferase family protein n=1 Tax=Pseudofrankia sp. BMG5.36 TaxID=1834512 RepID=UPI001F51D764|nr:aminoglycoside phosphotransferase family protein [Pseudofrankia sp. BMG5.36]
MTRGRTFSAVVTAGGDCLGTCGPYPAATPWWADVEPVVARLRRELGVPVMVLRLLGVDGSDGARDGHVRYHVEAFGRPAARRLAPWPGDPDELVRPVPLRANWATSVGLAEILDWARAALRAAGRPASGPAEQVRTWNLAGLFRFPTARGPVWLKATPPFAAPEAAVIDAFGRVDAELVPDVIAADSVGGRLLLDHAPGADTWEKSPVAIHAAVSRLVNAQAVLARDPAAIPRGLPDRTMPALIGQAAELLDGEAADELTPDELATARELTGHLPDLVAQLAACGLPDTVVHGDLHPRNWRSDGRRTTILDFADSHLGNPVLDGLRVRDFLADRQLRAHATDTWVTAWRTALPGSDPARALAVAEPLGHLSYAVRYQEFLDNIEPSERVYHAGDPAVTVRAALRHATAVATTAEA